MLKHALNNEQAVSGEMQGHERSIIVRRPGFFNVIGVLSSAWELLTSFNHAVPLSASFGLLDFRGMKLSSTDNRWLSGANWAGERSASTTLDLNSP